MTIWMFRMLIARCLRLRIGVFVALCFVSHPALSAGDDFCQPPETVSKVYAANPVLAYLVMAVAPDKLAGWNFPPPPQAKGIFPEASFQLPVIGGWFGQGRTPNMEVLLANQPDLIVMSGATVHLSRQQTLKDLGVPVCQLQLDVLSDYPLGFRRLGQWLGVPERGEALAQAAERVLTLQAQRRDLLAASGVPVKTVYYAESPNGLATECRGSIHSEVIPLAGGLNPHICPSDSAQQSRFGKVAINFEQLLKYDPDAIVTQERRFYDKVYRDPKWANLKAVRNQQVFFMPQTPFRWMDRPPSFMRLLASQWLMNRLYGDQMRIDMAAQVKTFYQQFFQVTLTDVQVSNILGGGTLNGR